MAKGNREGRRRLGLALGGLSGGACALLMAAVLVVYGLPWNPVWWWVMAAILVAAFVGPRAFAPAVEWIIEGYRDGA